MPIQFEAEREPSPFLPCSNCFGAVVSVLILWHPRRSGDFAKLSQLQVGGLVVGGDIFFYNQRDQIARLAARYALPATYKLSGFVLAGGLMSYAASLTDVYRQAAAYVVRIITGAKPPDLPVRQPTKFELTINMMAANALGLTIPPSFLARADEVIE